MATVWHNSGTRHYSYLWKNDWRNLRCIAVKASYVFLHQIDLALTILAPSYGLHEINPVVREMLSAPVSLLVMKVVVPILIAWLVPSRFLVPAVVLLAAIIVWNLKELLVLV